MEFKEYELSNVIDCYDKKRKPLSTMQRIKMKGEYPYYGAQEIIDYINDYLFDGKYILLAEDGENLRSRIKPLLKIVNGKFWLNNHAHIFKVKEGYNLEFIYYYLTKYDFQPYITGTTQPKLNQENMMKIKIKVPKLEIQNKIAYILLNIDKKIELNNQINDNLQKLCNVYYLSLIKDKYKEISLDELMTYQGGSQPPASEFQYISSKDNVRFVQIRDFDTDSHICYIPNSNKNKICQEDDILIARYGASLGRICYGLYGAYNVALAKVLPKDDKYKELIRIVLESKEFYEYINNVGQRSAQAGFNAGDIQAYKVKIPNDDNEIIKYNHLAKDCLNKRLLNNKENKRLEELQDTLLSKLMNGEIDLDKIEI